MWEARPLSSLRGMDERSSSRQYVEKVGQRSGPDKVARTVPKRKAHTTVRRSAQLYCPSRLIMVQEGRRVAYKTMAWHFGLPSITTFRLD